MSKAYIFNAGRYLPDEGNVSDYPEWIPFAEWFEEYMGYAPNGKNAEHVEWFECFYAGRIYQSETDADLEFAVKGARA